MPIGELSQEVSLEYNFSQTGSETKQKVILIQLPTKY